MSSTLHAACIICHCARWVLLCRQAQLQQGHEDYQSVAKREQREQERRRADQARDAERKTREEVCACPFSFVLLTRQIFGVS